MATCKRCGSEYSVWTAPIGAGICKNCNNAEFEAEAEKTKWAERLARGESIVAALDTDVKESAFDSSTISQKLCRRYSDAYTEAHAGVAVGKTIKGVGVVLAVIIVIGGCAMGSKGGREMDGIVVGISFALAFLVGIPTYILGILIAAQSQTQLATLDTAVNSSRHLTDDDVAKILSKRFSL